MWKPFVLPLFDSSGAGDLGWGHILESQYLFIFNYFDLYPVHPEGLWVVYRRVKTTIATKPE